MIAKHFLDKLRQKPNLMPLKIQALIKYNWKLVSTTNQCQNGRLLAPKWIEREYEEQFAHIRGYVQEILKKHEGSTALVETYQNAEKKMSSIGFMCVLRSLKADGKALVGQSLA